MKYPKEYLEEIKARLKVSLVVGKTVKLKKRGKEFIGLSPFSNEKTPSFTVNDQKGFYHCFSSTEHGNIFDFLMKTQSLNFREAVNKLAAEAGMQIYKFTKLDEEREIKWRNYKEILNEYAIFHNNELLSEKYETASQYLKNRKFSKEEIISFQIGYVDFKSDFYQTIKSKHSKDTIINSGLFYLDEKNKRYIERFRGRIIFPIRNVSDSIIAFGGRSIGNTKLAKYINSPETFFFKKGNNLFNINNARKINDPNEQALLVEGYTDVISLHRHGIKNVVANQGTALTERQLELIWRFFKNPIICFDGDKSGQEAAFRAAENLFSLLKPDYNIYFLFLPNNHDPDSYINEKNKDEFLNLIKQKIPIHDFLWNYFYNITNLDNPSELSSFEKKIKNLTSKIKDPYLFKHYSEYFLKKLSNLTPYLNIKKYDFKKYTKTVTPLSETKKTNIERESYSMRTLKEYSILYIIINYFSVFSKKIEFISEMTFSNSIMNDFKTKIVDILISGKILNKDDFITYFKDSKFIKLINEINNIAPVKMIIKNKNDQEISLIFDEICSEVEKIDLDNEINILENKMIKQMDEKTFEELLSLKNKIKSG